MVEDEHLEEPILVPLSVVGEESADTLPLEEPVEPVAESDETLDEALIEDYPAVEETPAPLEQTALLEHPSDLEEGPAAEDETEAAAEPEPDIELEPAGWPAELVIAAESVDSAPDPDITVAPASDPESGSVLAAEPDNYLGREYMANEKPDALTSPPQERRPLTDIINEGFDAKEQGRWEDAVNLFKQALETNRHPGLSVLLVLEVTCQYRDHGLYRQAIDFINGFLSLQGGLLDADGLNRIKNEMSYIEIVHSLLKQSGTPDLPSGKIPRLIRIKAEELFLQKKV
jgi:tetratricopeptide (TPR) repeat protein